VDAFIVLSGFCLFLPFVSDPGRFTSGSFLRRRAFRILPAYWASMVIAVTLPVVLVIVTRLVGLQANWQPFPPLKQWVTHLTMTHTFFPDTWNGINGVYWSLGLEVQFYVFLPLLILLYRRYGIRSLAIPIGISLIWNAVLFVLWPTPEFNVVHFLWGANVFGRWFEFCFGMAAAWLVVRRHHRQLQFPPLVRQGLVALAVATFGLCLVDGGPTGLQLLGYALATAVMLVVLSEGRGWTARMMRFRPLALAGARLVQLLPDSSASDVVLLAVSKAARH
jgi:peptidoglycan/LPS O-acetylase OafA/YrhL